MYKHILVPLENSSADPTILEHIRKLADFCKARITFIHVADGFGARYQKTLNLADSEEIHIDKDYLDKTAQQFRSEGFEADFHLAKGDPVREILDFAESKNCDLIAMSTHGHRIFADVLFGSVASAVRHRTSIPVLLVRVPR